MLDANRPRSPSPFRETKEKVMAGASALGKKFQELVDKAFTPKTGNGSNSNISRQQYNNLPDDDGFDSLLGAEGTDTPLGMILHAVKCRDHID